MNKQRRSRLSQFKTKASLLLKDLQSSQSELSLKAAERLTALPFLQGGTAAGVLKDLSFFRLKHALWVIALENGNKDWASLRTKVIKEDCLAPGAGSGLNAWFNNYAEAKQYQQANGGYLLQYRKDFLVCESGYIEGIGLIEYENEWKRIGYDWVQPRDKAAWNVLFAKAKEFYLARA